MVRLSIKHHVVNPKSGYVGHDNECILVGKVNPLHVFLRKKESEIIP